MAAQEISVTINCKSVAKMQLIVQPVFKYRVFLWVVFRDIHLGVMTEQKVLSRVDIP